jgi:ribonucleotide reductase beta subunit family protein with ferritin-like domain
MKEQIVINYDVLTYEQLSEEDKALVENAKAFFYFILSSFNNLKETL